jgi:hypothetical protein
VSRTKNPTGSLWHRWDPHIHVPGTAQNDQYGAATLDDFCRAVTACDPPIRALGITDYLSIDIYEELLKKKEAGKLPKVDLLFPNVEARLDIGTAKGKGVNIHLLFCPDDANHLSEIRRFLSRLTFRHKVDDYSCTKSDLIRLGRAVDPTATDDSKALSVGINQFKVSITKLEDELKANTWAQENLLIGVAASSNDGTAGVTSTDSQFEAIRTNIESASDLIFSGNPRDAQFWIGKGVRSAEEVVKKYRTLKPCIHGCDAHSADKVGKPDDDRYCWIKGDVTFETLKQTCIEPEERAFVGKAPPRGGLVGQTITSLSVTNANWMVPNELPLNPGLVAIIGARGSGKTALADFLAVGSYSMSAHVNERSFIRRARGFLNQSKVTVKWESQEETSGSLASFESDEDWEDGRVQYLSQQFVDDLCSSEGVTDRLLGEIKRVIFVSHPEAEREGADDFDSLYAVRCSGILEQRKRHEAELDRLTEQFLQQWKLKQSIPDLTKKIGDLEKAIEQDLKDKGRLVSKDQESRVQRHEEIQQVLVSRKAAWETEQKKVRALKALQGDLTQFRTRTAVAFVDDLKVQRSESGLSASDWQSIVPKIGSDADDLIARKLEAATKQSAAIYGTLVPPQSDEKLLEPMIDEKAALKELTVCKLQAESDRLAKLIGVDQQNAKRFVALTQKIQAGQKQLEGFKSQLLVARKADEEIKRITGGRREVYRQVFDTFVELQSELSRLYAPLKSSLASEEGALGKLKFVVRRVVDLDRWVDLGEDLLDLRKDGPFKGRGSLKLAAQKKLLPAWESADPAAADKAVDAFIEEHRKEIGVHRPDSMEFKEWSARIWQWLLATDHIKVTYGLQYGDVDIERLSPGTRGIVLLLLYLAIDKDDVRPLIIDQPEENLDPQSVYDELVQRFRDARQRRQIIIVTHNANLVVNTDADQVIVATAGEHGPGQLPEIRYEAGGLESEYVRRKVCEILEGGEEAFRARARRLRVKLD